MRLLLVEDNVPLADELQRDCKRAGYAVDWLSDGRDALHAARVTTYDLIILDVGLPGLSGLEVLRSWRRDAIETPVLILTARDQWTDRIDGLKAGADDYLPKPFHPEELQLRLQALARRRHGVVPKPVLAVGHLQLDETAQRVRQGDTWIDLKGAEFKLLRYLMLNPEKIISKTELFDHLYDDAREPDSNVLEVMINQLRRKLGKAIVQTHRGQGYRLCAESVD